VQDFVEKESHPAMIDTDVTATRIIPKRNLFIKTSKFPAHKNF
jgi:hypothetical protein